MIRLVENCNVRKFFKKGHPETFRRYWVFRAYSSPSYRFPDDQEFDLEKWDGYIASFLFPGHDFIDIGKFDLAFPVFDMDEWTSVIGFVSSPDKAPEIASYIAKYITMPEKIISRYPSCELLEFLWVDGWWEIFGDVDLASDLIKPDLVSVDVQASAYLNKEYDKEDYDEAHQKLRHRVKEKKALD